MGEAWPATALMIKPDSELGMFMEWQERTAKEANNPMEEERQGEAGRIREEDKRREENRLREEVQTRKRKAEREGKMKKEQVENNLELFML